MSSDPPAGRPAALDLVQAVTAAGETDERAAAGAVLDAAREALLAELAGEVVFALSQGGKELFHTNLLAWFAERYPPVARALLAVADADAAPHGVRAFREWKKLDLVLDAVGPDGALGGSVLVVENKLFARTDTDQLERYGAAVESLSGPPALALLTLVDPGWADGTWADSSGRQWTRISYASVADALRNAAPELPEGFDRQVLIKWADHQDRLHRLAALFGRPDDDEPVLLPKPVRARLERVRLDATVQKMRYQWLVRRVLDRTGGLPAGTRINADVTRANGLAQGWVLMPDGREVGWQLQSGQWRRPMLFPEGDPVLRRGRPQARGEVQGSRLVDPHGLVSLGSSGGPRGRQHTEPPPVLPRFRVPLRCHARRDRRRGDRSGHCDPGRGACRRGLGLAPHLAGHAPEEPSARGPRVPALSRGSCHAIRHEALLAPARRRCSRGS